ncbi:hypothetical protein TRP8649_00306 [Pelagimonas phthalicica]|uniref:Lipoprotein n=1 Tax=Pelagimonas phthalicica TaxID=1037362 RepID=A0A238J7B3_9RHOB|nr:MULTISPECIES: hypothetical protein [Roseobacteraceae]MBO9463765.1 hypothetical protein [Tropicibacter sp. R15_0]TDS95243.1 hypothetical protein CLV87_1766 [Pelagimonas phthalicica]SMX26233.1 hypothetical protein TRP8649_00306 [Pelagimonas phthalicica]
MFKRLVNAALVFGMAAIAPPAFAQSHCAPRDIIVSKLQEKYSEQLTSGGLTQGDPAKSVVEIWTSKETGSFTVLVSTATGISCIVAAGTEFFEAEPVKKVDGIPS